MTVDTMGNLVGGAWRPARDGEVLEVRDPADVRRVVGAVPAMGPTDVGQVYDAAEDGARTWRRASPLERASVLTRAATLLRERRESLAAVLVSEMGKPLADARVEVTKSADFFDFYASLARLPRGEILADARPGTEAYARTEPVGVVLAVTPWNDPMLTPARKLAPALAAGNSVVLKPASDTPLIALHLAQALHDAGLPSGVLGTVTGSSRTLADALLHDPRLAAVSFTGSTATGLALRRELASTHVRLQTEMGGKNASVILADADLDLAVESVCAAAFGQSGQRCTATSRVIVEESVVDDVRRSLAARAGSYVLGPGSDPSTTLGPLVSPVQQSTVLEHVERARAEGGQVLVGGSRPPEPRLEHGCYVQPTLVDGVRPDMSLWREEVFGPVLALTTAADADEAVLLVNDSDYGLAAAVYTTDLGHAQSFIDCVDAGQVSVNLPTSGWDVHLPFGGFGASGSAFKEQGEPGLRFYTRIKTAAVRSRW